MIKYIYKSDNMFAIDTATEEVNKLDCAYISSLYLIEKDGELTVYNRDGSKQVCHVAAGDVITECWLDRDLRIDVIKSPELAKLVKAKMDSRKVEFEGIKEDGQTVDR